MENRQKFRGWISIGGLFLLTILVLNSYMPNNVVAGDRFFTCSNSNSPCVLDRREMVAACCDGSVEEKQLTRKNLMIELKHLASALRKVSRGKVENLDDLSSYSERSDCYSRSMSFIAGAIKGFPPEKNQDQVAEYNQLADRLTTTTQRVLSWSAKQSKRKALIANDKLQDTCGMCHVKFR